MNPKTNPTLLRITGITGVIGALGYVAGDVLLLGSPEKPEEHPAIATFGLDKELSVMLKASPNRLRAGALAGVLSTPLYAAGIWHFAKSVRSGDWPATIGVSIIAGAITLDSFAHGIFWPVGLQYQKADQALQAGNPTAAAEYANTGKHLQKGAEPAFAAALLGVGIGSLIWTWSIAKGNTPYPKWAAAVVPPVWPIVTYLLTNNITKKLPGGYLWQGAPISFGMATAWAVSTALRWQAKEQ